MIIHAADLTARIHSPLNITVVTETFAPEVNGVAITMGRMVEGLLARGHGISMIRPRQRNEALVANGSELPTLRVMPLPVPGYAGVQAGWAALSRLLRLWRTRRPDLVHIITEGPLGLQALRAARRLGLPCISDFHTNFHRYSQHYGAGFIERPLAAYLRGFHNRTQLTLVPTRELADDLAARGYENLRVVGRGADTALFNPRRRSVALRASWGARPDDLVMICVGRIAAEKNLELLFAAHRAVRMHVPNARLIMVGDGPRRAALEKQHADVQFVGVKLGEDLAAHYASADLFLFPSLTETFGNVTLEALASGLPVVAFDYAAAREWLRDGGLGVLAPMDDQQAFVAGALRLAQDRALLARMREQTVARARMISWPAVIEQVEGAYREALMLRIDNVTGMTKGVRHGPA